MRNLVFVSSPVIMSAALLWLALERAGLGLMVGIAVMLGAFAWMLWQAAREGRQWSQGKSNDDAC